MNEITFTLQIEKLKTELALSQTHSENLNSRLNDCFYEISNLKVKIKIFKKIVLHEKYKVKIQKLKNKNC